MAKRRPPAATVGESTPESVDAVAAPLRESELWAEARARHYDADIVAPLAKLVQQRGRSLPPFIEYYAVSGQAERGELSYTEAVRLLWLGQTAAAPSSRAEMAMLERLLEQDTTDLRFLRRLRDLKRGLGEPMEPIQEELALRADLLLDPQNLAAAHRLARVLGAQGKPISPQIEKMSLREDLRKSPNDVMSAFNLQRVLDDQEAPFPIEIERPAAADQMGPPGEQNAGQLSYAEVQRLLSLQQTMPSLSPGAEIAILQQLLNQDATDLRLLRRLRDLRKGLGEPMQPMQEELALRADLLLNPQNLSAAHILARVLQAQGKPISPLIEELSLKEDLRKVPGDPGCAVRLGQVLVTQRKPVPAEVEEAALNSIVQPGSGDGPRARRLCQVMVAERHPVPAFVERMALADCGYETDQIAIPDGALRDLAGEYDAVLSQFCAEPAESDNVLISNGIPKCGTHLLSQFVKEASGYKDSRLHFHDGFATVNYGETQRQVPSNVLLIDPLTGILPRIRIGYFITAHLKWSIPAELNLSTSGIKMLMIYRDPLDAIVSRMRWEFADQFAEMTAQNRDLMERQSKTSVSEHLTDLLKRMTREDWGDNFLEYFGWLNWPGCLAISFKDLYNDVLDFERGEIGSAVRAIAEFLGFSFNEANLPDLSRRIYGHGPTYVPGADKIGRYRRQELFQAEHYDLIRGTWIEAAIEVFPGSDEPAGGRGRNRWLRPQGPETKDPTAHQAPEAPAIVRERAPSKARRKTARS